MSISSRCYYATNVITFKLIIVSLYAIKLALYKTTLLVVFVHIPIDST